MRRIILAVALGFICAAAYSLPGDLVVLSEKEVRPDEAAGLYYLGQGGGGYLYNGSAAALAAVAPYRLLDRDAQAKDYYIVWAPEWVPLAPEDFAALGEAVRLSEYEILVGLERGFGPADLRAVEHRIELIKLAPVTPVDWSYDGEAPPRKKDPRIAAAVNTITAEEYASYIKRLQDFKTRCSETEGCDRARDWLRTFFASQRLEASLFEFECTQFEAGFYPEPRKNIYVLTDHWTLYRTRDLGRSWEVIQIPGIGYVGYVSWPSSDAGFAAGSRNRLAATDDGGDTWKSREIRCPGTSGDYNPTALHFVDSEVGYVAATFRKHGARSPSDRKPVLLKTTDGGRSWRRLPIPGDFYAYTIAFFDRRHGWVAEYVPSSRTGRILYTADGGATWRECTTPATNRSVWDIAAVGPAAAWAADRTANLLHTTDGLTWESVVIGARGGLSQVEFPDERHGYASHAELVATADGGETWRYVSGLPKTVYTAVAFADKNHGIIGGYWGKYLYRTDDGAKTFVDVKGDIDLCAENVVAERQGYERPDEIVIIGGHYDSISDDPLLLAPGAEDNASGTACAMAAARAFRNVPFKRTVRYMAFGDEERGLTGSRAYARHCAEEGQKIVAVLNADMVSYDEEHGARDDLTAGFGDNGEWLFDYLTIVGGLYGNRLVYDLGRGPISDDWSFDDVGYAAIGVIEGGAGEGGGQDYPWYHSSEDTLDKLHPEFGVRFVRDYAAMLAHLAGVGDELIEQPEPGRGAVPYARPFAVYPNPYGLASMTGGVHFVGVKSPATVELYDLAGRRVAREEVAAGGDECCWEPAAAGGESVSPGVYLYRVEGQGQAETGKVVVVK
ncbi:MAG: M20/M25/M40 family metallo-hydrolase [Candidatus Coatesbacteria bacterium]|nr:MAG: M20/M25/M40 family metallo-hydrolase [Candidatus Coatesbacteria bacterium]